MALHEGPLVKELPATYLVRKNLPPIRLVHSCDYFSNAYGLNRLLTLLVGQFIQERLQRAEVFFPRRRLAAIRHPGGVPCTGRPQRWLSCHGKHHEIDLVEANDCRHDPKRLVSAESLRPNVLIIRHGIDTTAMRSLPVITIDGITLPRMPDVALPRQMIAYHPAC